MYHFFTFVLSLYVVQSGMKINTKIRYGLRTMIEIADCQSSEGILQKDIAQRQQISVKYLDYIVGALKLKGLIRNVGGRGSGYVLARPAIEITMLDIYTAFESILVVQCVSDETFCERSSLCCKAKLYWKQFHRQFVEMLAGRNLEQIMQETIDDCALCD
ncbi:MAG TPA: Rrf2 family transcriptional regulator [Porphyromonadaceae bacterium]|nr:Rrf2 family transcriptional regulator [Porphyromonadaceae bacterium]HCC19145.1 Rrf2 family transcriptional regulator [Porphyromonadaceae bacterium]